MNNIMIATPTAMPADGKLRTRDIREFFRPASRMNKPGTAKLSNTTDIDNLPASVERRNTPRCASRPSSRCSESLVGTSRASGPANLSTNTHTIHNNKGVMSCHETPSSDRKRRRGRVEDCGMSSITASSQKRKRGMVRFENRSEEEVLSGQEESEDVP